ncbi:MAG: cupin domain-containing protein [Bacteroidetes bacterium]|nr:MAG: cupin domain-containing protein [Bacteroidota bacterium]
MMSRMLFSTIITLLLTPGFLMAQKSMRDLDKGPKHHIILTANDEKNWQQSPVLEPDLKVAILEGNPSEPGVFTLRIKIPDGGYISPHWHPNVERVTVLSGRFLLGSGEKMDRNKVKKLDPGSYTSMPPGMRHFAIAEGETVIQLTSVGPWEINYINPQDDPRNR